MRARCLRRVGRLPQALNDLECATHIAKFTQDLLNDHTIEYNDNNNKMIKFKQTANELKKMIELEMLQDENKEGIGSIINEEIKLLRDEQLPPPLPIDYEKEVEIEYRKKIQEQSLVGQRSPISFPFMPSSSHKASFFGGIDKNITNISTLLFGKK